MQARKEKRNHSLLIYILLLGGIFCATATQMRNYYLLHFIFAMSFSAALCIAGEMISENFRRRTSPFYFYIIVSILIVMLPMMMNGFFYGDDLWGYAKDISPEYKNINGSIALRRPMCGIINAMFLSVSFDSSWIYRTVNTIVLTLSSFILFAYIHKARKNAWLAFAFVLLFSCSSVMIDSVAYLSVSPVFYSLFSSATAYITFEKGYNEKKHWYYFAGGLLLVVAFMLYQITTPIVFVMFMISIYQKTQKDSDYFRKAFALLMWYGIVAVLYLLISNGIMKLYGVVAAQTDRAQFVSSLPAIISKLKWFIEIVIPQTCYKIVASILGFSSYTTNNLFYEVHFSNNAFSTIVMLLILGLTIVYFLRFVFQKRYLSLFIGLCAIILSFYPFLILPESYSLSYYLIPIVALFIYYAIEGAGIICRQVSRLFNTRIWAVGEKLLLCIGYVVACAVIIHGAFYASNWVNYCRDSHIYIRQYLSSSLTKETEKICISGRISPYVGGNPYVILSTQLALEELGYDPNHYQIMQIDNPYYIVEIPASSMEKAKESLSEDDFDHLNTYYLYDGMYNRYLYNYSADQEGKQFIQRCLIDSDLIYLENSEQSIYFSLDGFTKTHPF